MSPKKGSKDLHLELLTKISDHVQETTKTMAALDKKLDLHIQKTEIELKSINEMDAIQNQLLDQHIQGVNTLKKWCDIHEEANEARFSKIEEPRKWLKGTFKIVAVLGSIATAIAGFAKLFHWF